MIVPQELAELIKSEIRIDVAHGIVPPTVASFSELHDYVDANCYGNTEAMCEVHTLQDMCELLNLAQQLVDDWIKAGGLTTERSNHV